MRDSIFQQASVPNAAPRLTFGKQTDAEKGPDRGQIHQDQVQGEQDGLNEWHRQIQSLFRFAFGER